MKILLTLRGRIVVSKYDFVFLPTVKEPDFINLIQKFRARLETLWALEGCQPPFLKIEYPFDTF